MAKQLIITIANDADEARVIRQLSDSYGYSPEQLAEGETPDPNFPTRRQFCQRMLSREVKERIRKQGRHDAVVAANAQADAQSDATIIT